MRKKIELDKIEERKGEGDNIWEEIEKKKRLLPENERRERIRNSRYNRWYGTIKNEGVLGYLKKGWGESRWRRIARFKLGNEMRE